MPTGATRSTVAALGLLALACGAPAGTAPAEPAVQADLPGPPHFRHPVALQLYSLRESFASEGVPATLAKVRAMGFTHVELAGTYGLGRDAFKAALDDAGLTPVSMHVDIEALLADPAAFVDDARFYGLEQVGNAWFPHTGTFDAADADRAIAVFNAAGQALAAAGLTFFYHPHGFEFAPAAGGGTLFDRMVAGTDPDTVAFQLDIFWAYQGGADPVTLIERYPTRFVSTHLKDMAAGTPRNHTGSAPGGASVALGRGVVDVLGVLDAARESSIVWHIIEEESAAPEVNIPAGLRYLRSIGPVEPPA